MLTPAYAYLVGVLNIARDPPTLHSVGVYSDPSPTVKISEHRTFVIGDASAPTFGEAQRRVLTIALHHPLYRWCLPYFDERTRIEFERL